MEKNTENKGESIVGITMYPPLFYLFIFLLSVLADYYYPITIPAKNYSEYLGLVVIFFATGIIIWAQHSIGRFVARERSGAGARDFEVGAYKYSRHPTYAGLFLLMLGFALLSSSVVMIFGAVVSFVVVNFTVVKKEERLLLNKYGNEYNNYKSRVRPWI
ncbi:MAG: isoprenylcysteine carboxylmethyltransferase family protein [Patescibacteria group bacterium]